MRCHWLCTAIHNESKHNKCCFVRLRNSKQISPINSFNGGPQRLSTCDCIAVSLGALCVYYADWKSSVATIGDTIESYRIISFQWLLQMVTECGSQRMDRSEMGYRRSIQLVLCAPCLLSKELLDERSREEKANWLSQWSHWATSHKDLSMQLFVGSVRDKAIVSPHQSHQTDFK